MNLELHEEAHSLLDRLVIAQETLYERWNVINFYPSDAIAPGWILDIIQFTDIEHVIGSDGRGLTIAGLAAALSHAIYRECASTYVAEALRDLLRANAGNWRRRRRVLVDALRRFKESASPKSFSLTP